MSERPEPRVSGRSQPRFRSRERRDELSAAFRGQGADYDRLRPGYPDAVVDAIVGAADHRPDLDRRVLAVDLGAGTGKLSLALAALGVDVVAVDPSEQMLAVAADAARAHGTSDTSARTDPPTAPGPSAPSCPRAATSLSSSEPGILRTVVGTAETTGLPGGCADLVTSAQAWHWFDTDAASAEAARLLRSGGVLALLWNTMDVQVPWVHRFSRIMHAGDVQRDDFSPPIAGGFELERRVVHRWEDPMLTTDLVDLARTRSYVITASDAVRAKVLANLDWYVHDHLGHARGSTVGLPYRTDLFLYRADS